MQITDSARAMLQNVLQDKGANGIRVYFAGYG
jgi:hypothetical protein